VAHGRIDLGVVLQECPEGEGWEVSAAGQVPGEACFAEAGGKSTELPRASLKRNREPDDGRSEGLHVFDHRRGLPRTGERGQLDRMAVALEGGGKVAGGEVLLEFSADQQVHASSPPRTIRGIAFLAQPPTKGAIRDCRGPAQGPAV